MQIIIGLPSAEPLAHLAAQVERILAVSLARRSSMYFGGEHFRAGAPAHEEVMLHPNRGLSHEGVEPPLAYPEAPDCPAILRLDATARPAAELVSALADALGVTPRLLHERAIGSPRIRGMKGP